MKKIVALIISLLLIFTCFTVVSFATNDTTPIVSFSEEYDKLYVGDQSYTRVDTSMLNVDYYYYWKTAENYQEDDKISGETSVVKLELTDAQKQEIKKVDFARNKQSSIVEASIYFINGSCLTVSYLKDIYLDDYNRVVNGEATNFKVDFIYPTGNVVEVTRNQLMSNPVTLTVFELSEWTDCYDVFAVGNDSSIQLVAGMIITVNEVYYYVDYKETGINSEDFWLDSSHGVLAGKQIYKITDEALCKEFDIAIQKYFEDDYGIMYDDEAIRVIATIFFVLMFALVPLIVLVIFLVKAIKGKGVYKKMYFTISTLCLLEIIVFTILSIVVVKFN